MILLVCNNYNINQKWCRLMWTSVTASVISSVILISAERVIISDSHSIWTNRVNI